MANYIELDKQASFPNSSNVGKLIFGVNTSNEVILTDSSGTTYNFGSGATSTLSFDTYDDIDLSVGDYTIVGPGIYRVLNSNPGNKLFFPDPSLYSGRTLIVMNSDESNQITPGETTAGWAPYGVTNTQYSVFYTSTVYTFYSIGNVWRGTGIAFQV